MSEQDRQSKTEAPSKRRREEARKRGDVVVSTDLTSGLGLLAATTTMMLGGGRLSQDLLGMVRRQLSVLPTELTPATLSVVSWAAFGQFASVVAVLLMVVVGAHLLFTVIQAGFKISFEPLRFNWNRVNPVNGWTRLFSMNSLVKGGLAATKMLTLVIIVLVTTRSQLTQLRFRMPSTIAAAAALNWDIVLSASLAVSIALVVIGVLDYGYQRWRSEIELRMTKQEVKDERKDEEGDPLLKARVKRVQREMSQGRMLKDVATATVVLTNPTHYAIALKYEVGTLAAPRVVAKGVDEVAKRIRELAAENDVPLLERRQLARSLYRSVNVGDEIPPELYHAIAEIVAYLYRIGKFRAVA